MTKHEFLTALLRGLDSLPKKDLDETLHFYGEIIDDRMEEGLPEEEAVAAAGDVEEIIAQIMSSVPKDTSKKIKQKKGKKSPRLKTWEIVLLAVGSPLWIALGIAAFAVILSLLICMWAVVISLWAAFVSLNGSGFGGVLGGVILLFTWDGIEGMALLGGGLVCGGLSIFLFYGCKWLTEQCALLTKKLIMWIKSIFTKKGAE